MINKTYLPPYKEGYIPQLSRCSQLIRNRSSCSIFKWRNWSLEARWLAQGEADRLWLLRRCLGEDLEPWNLTFRLGFAMWETPGPSLLSWSLSWLTCRMGIIIVATSQGGCVNGVMHVSSKWLRQYYYHYFDTSNCFPVNKLVDREVSVCHTLSKYFNMWTKESFGFYPTLSPK